MIGNNRFWAGLVMLALCCCSSNKEFETPEGYLLPEKMRAIMVDLHMIEGAKAGISVVGDSLPVAYYYESLYQKHNITAAQLDSNLQFYASHQEVLDKIYENVINDLVQLEAQLEKDYAKKRKEESPTPPDSVLKESIDSLKIGLPGVKKR
ncbi:MAG: DUF4296 domain-containing protein [Schleiferiaceae bacterium]|nr:DUF4296 domain-containing protein [Schleiferiaceae bacterium]